jgi:hypothetical protein
LVVEARVQKLIAICAVVIVKTPLTVRKLVMVTSCLTMDGTGFVINSQQKMGINSEKMGVVGVPVLFPKFGRTASPVTDPDQEVL